MKDERHCDSNWRAHKKPGLTRPLGQKQTFQKPGAGLRGPFQSWWSSCIPGPNPEGPWREEVVSVLGTAVQMRAANEERP